MSKKINPVNGVEIDPMFDGHLEKPLSKMTPKEKLDYLWMQTVFNWEVRTKVKRVNDENENSNQNK
ncbi:MAG TPA: hypothetical protein PKC91_15580 [Ignavibacteria bacterium]|nr:hypothetical protein [Ignavibacteria bacterium]